MKNYTEEQVREYQIALQIAGINTSRYACEIIMHTKDGFNKLKGQFSLADGCKIKAAMDEKYKGKDTLLHEQIERLEKRFDRLQKEVISLRPTTA